MAVKPKNIGPQSLAEGKRPIIGRRAGSGFLDRAGWRQEPVRVGTHPLVVDDTL